VTPSSLYVHLFLHSCRSCTDSPLTHRPTRRSQAATTPARSGRVSPSAVSVPAQRSLAVPLGVEEFAAKITSCPRSAPTRLVRSFVRRRCFADLYVLQFRMGRSRRVSQPPSPIASHSHHDSVHFASSTDIVTAYCAPCVLITNLPDERCNPSHLYRVSRCREKRRGSEESKT
jgi:hypothetical protein